MRKLLALTALSLAVLGGTAEQTRAHADQKRKATCEGTVGWIQVYRHRVWELESMMGARRTLSANAEKPTACGYARWIYRLWKKRAHDRQATFRNPPHLKAWLCIHHYEGAWNDPNAPYYGGLQMDLEFQQTYGSYLLRTKGTADHWTPLEQIWVAERAYESGRGFSPWPNTARYCQLI